MPFSNTGVFSRLYNWLTEQASPPIELSKLDAQEEDFATGLSNCMLRDGTSLPSANMDWNGKRLTNLGAATTSSDAVSLGTGDARWALKGSANTWAVGQTLPALSLTNPSDPRLYWVVSSAPVNNQRWDVITNGTSWKLRVVNDTDTASADAFVINRTGTTVDAVGLAATTVGFTGKVYILTQPGNFADDASAAAGGVGIGQIYRNGSQLMIRVS